MLFNSNSPAVKTTLKIIEWVFLLLVFGLILLTASSALPTKKLLSSYVVASGSMEPTIQTGSIVLTSYHDPEVLEVGDVITFTQPTDPNTVIVHRIIGKTSDSIGFTTQGDNNEIQDAWIVAPQNILGKTVISVPYLGHVISHLKTPVGFMIGIGVPSLILALFQVKKILEGINEEVDRRTQLALAKHGIDPKEKMGLVLLFLLSSLLFSTHTAQALFSDTATLTGLSIQTTAAPLPPPPPSDTDPQLFFYPYEGNEEVGFSLSNIAPFREIQYELQYERSGGIQEQLGGELNNDERQNNLASPRLFLGTCSGDDCTPHEGVSEVFLKVILIDDEGGETTLNATLRLDHDTPVLELPEACRPLTGQISTVLEGQMRNNFLVGTDANELILGGSGNDVIEANGGNDCIVTGSGNHTIQAGAGDDIIIAGNGADVISGGSGHDRILAGSGSNSVSGNQGNDFIIGGSGYDVLNGNEGNDSLDGQQGLNVLDGGPDQDLCHNGTVKNSCEL